MNHWGVNMGNGLVGLMAASALASVLAPTSAVGATDSASPSATKATTVAPLVITAERRTLNLQVTPVAASVIAGGQLQAKGIDSIDDLQFHTPSLTVSDFGQGNLFNIRGIGKDLTNIQTPSGVVTYWDGVAAFPGFFQDAPYYDIANVEVLRGPQGTFAGQNATGGAVFITTNDPQLGHFGGALEGQYGNYTDGLVRGVVNLPLGQTLALRLAFDGEREDSFYTISGGGTSRFGGSPGRLLEGSLRLGLLWKPNDAFQAVLKWESDYIDHGGALGDPAVDFANPTELNPGDAFVIGNNAVNWWIDKFDRASLNASYRLASGITLKSITGYQYGITNEQIDLDGTSLLPFTFRDYGQERIWSEELDAISPNRGPFTWVGGLYFQSDVVNLPPGVGFDIHIPGAVPGVADINLTYHTPKTTEAVFGQVGYDLTSQLQFELGARYTHSTFGLDDDNFFNNSPPGLILHASTSDDALTGKAALTWRPNSANTVYAFIAEGHKQNGINTDPATPFGSEEVTDIEAGWKPTLFDGHLRAQLGGYYSLYRHFQLQYLTPTQVSLIQNVSGTTTIYGFEGETQAVFGPLSFDAGLSYEHSSLGQATITDPSTGLPVALGGRALPLAPTWTANVGAQYAIPLGDGRRLTPRVDYSYVSSQWATPFQRLGEYLTARNLVNAELAFSDGPWTLTAYTTNAFNERYIVAVNAGVPFNLRYAGPPRQYGLRLARRF
ncbi:MAG: TonB-dependent receptor [Caulobacteraceae bacterium]